MANRTCSVDGCERPSRKRGWCEMHYQRWRKNGSVRDEDQAWVVGPRGDCIVCGAVVADGGEFRKYCSRSCAVMGSRDSRPRSRECAICGESFSLTERSPRTGRLRYSSATTCGAHSKPSGLSRHIPDLLARDADGCGICGDPVDVTLAYPHQMSPSIDHVLPRSRGGRDALDNYRLTHLICNVRRQNKV